MIVRTVRIVAVKRLGGAAALLMTGGTSVTSRVSTLSHFCGISEAVAMVLHLIPTGSGSNHDQQNKRDKKADKAEHDASNGHAFAGIALGIVADLYQADDGKNQSQDIKGHAVTTKQTTTEAKNHR